MTVLVIAHARHYLNWRTGFLKGENYDVFFRLVRREEDLRGYDPKETFILPLYKNGTGVHSEFDDLFSQACEHYRTVECRQYTDGLRLVFS